MPFSRICRGLTALAAVILLVTSPDRPASAHHSAAIFDLERTVTLEGVVTRYDWVNPHVYLYVDVGRDAEGPSIWEIEASPPTLMVRRGWSPTTFEPGDRVSVRVNPGKDSDGRMALGRTVSTPDGKTWIMSRNTESIAAPPRDGLPGGDELRGDELIVDRSGAAAAGLAGTWATTVDPAGQAVARQFLFGPDMWPLNDSGAEALASYDDSLNPAADCVAYTAPFSMVFPDTKIIEFNNDAATIRSSLDDVVRTIRFDVDSHEDAPPSNQGFSIGRWEGGALIVETAAFAPRLNGNAMRLPSSNRKHLSERFELSEDGTLLRYRFELTDPQFLAEPVTGDSEWAYSPDLEFAAQGCDLENARRYLRGLPSSSSD